MNAPKFKSFEAMILYFNGMYKLPIAASPSTESEYKWQQQKFPAQLLQDEREAVLKRMKDFFGGILQKELDEHTDILDKLYAKEYQSDIEVLTDLADLLGDLIVYCASEMVRYGIPINETLRIIMDSNFSKLDADGLPIYDATGKVMKGPNYWKPEPKIMAMLLQLQQEGAPRGRKDGE